MNSSLLTKILVNGQKIKCMMTNLLKIVILMMKKYIFIFNKDVKE